MGSAIDCSAFASRPPATDTVGHSGIANRNCGRRIATQPYMTAPMFRSTPPRRGRRHVRSGESRHRIPGASVGQPTEPSLSGQIRIRLRELHMDAAILHGLDGVGDLQELAGCRVAVGVRPVRGEFHMPSLSSRMGRPGREKKRANAPKGEVRFAPINGHRQAVSACPNSANRVIWHRTKQAATRSPRRRGQAASVPRGVPQSRACYFVATILTPPILRS
jgi:hypothetical protein